jgi:hypothetical protein
MAVTYEPIATTTLGSTSSSVVFSSIPQTYTDLVVVFTGKNTTATDAMTFECDINGDGGNNYSSTYIDIGNGTSGRGTGNNGLYIGQMSKNGTAWAVINFMDYSNTTTYKATISRWGVLSAPFPGAGTIAGLWRDTSAITQINFNRPAGEAGTFDVGCTFTLYGIKAA